MTVRDPPPQTALVASPSGEQEPGAPAGSSQLIVGQQLGRAAWARPPLRQSQQKRHVCLSVSLYFLGYHENGVVKAENGTSPRTKKLKSP